tara:strand:- start:897 stop:1817 length:921 start_codon:yes stop_codon:yes gene_type:complete
MSESKSKISIVMNCYNGERFLKNAIDSIYRQTFRDWEIIFWDNCSNDSSSQIAKSYDNKLKYFKSNKKTILGEARYLAMQMCNSKYICFLDCDDEYMPDKLSIQYKFMEETKYVFSCSQELLINDKGFNIYTPKIKIKSGYIFSDLLVNYQIGFQSAMIRKSLLDRENITFSKKFTNFCDYDLFMKIACNHQIGVIHKPLVKHRITRNSLTSSAYERVSHEMKLTLDDIFINNPNLKIKYNNEVKKSYNKLNYYDAINDISNNNYGSAKKKLNKILFDNIKYFALYLLLTLKINRFTIMRILRRTT